jgi:phosphate-selective porin
MRLLTGSAAALALLWAAAPAAAQSGPTLEERVRKLEMSAQESGKMPDGERTGSAGSRVDAWFDDGLRFKSADGNFEGRLGAHVIVHYTWNPYRNEGDGKIDGFSIRDAAVDAYARIMKSWEVYVRAQILPGGTSLYYGWAEFNKWDEVRLRAGLFKMPYSPETMEDNRWMDMPENSMVSLTAPGRDLGAMAHGAIGGGIFGYAVGVFNGNGTGGDYNSDKDGLVRVVLRPGAKSESDYIKHLYIGGGVTRGEARSRDVSSEGPISMRAPATGTVWHDSNATGGGTVLADENIFRAGADLAYIAGPFEIKSEYSFYKAGLEDGTGDDFNFRAHAWYAQAAFWIGGSRAPHHRPEVDKPLFGDKGGFGAFQFVGRFSQIRVNDVLEEKAGFGGSRSAKEYAVAVNWYPCAYARISAMYVRYEYDNEDTRLVPLAGGHQTNDEDAVVLRAQVDF